MQSALKSWPTDYGACVGEGCKLRDNCKRYQGHLLAVEQKRPRQSYTSGDVEDCRSFWALVEVVV